MSLIRQRTKNLIISGIVGAFIILLPCTVLMVFLYTKNIEYKEKAADIEQKAALTEINYIYVLNENIAANEVLKSKHIKEVPISGFKPESLSSNDIIGKRAKIDLKETTILTEDMLYKGEEITNDLRLHNYNYINLPSQLLENDCIDIRIVFPNGKDFVVAAKKKVLSMSEGGVIWLKICEEEILRLSSAVVDAYLNDGHIYAIKYVDELQEAATINYPVNKEVNELMLNDPNIIKRAENVLISEKRKSLEESFENLSTNAEINSSFYEDNIQKEYEISDDSEYEEIEFIN